MKTSQNLFFISLVLFLFIASCTNQQNGDADNLKQQMQDLESKVDNLQIQLDDQKLKTRISFRQISSSLLFNSPWDAFLNESDNYWDHVVDVGLSECSKNCAKLASQRRKACDELPDGPEKAQCFTNSAIAAATCNENCSARFPPDLN